MARQFSAAVRNAIADAYEAAIGTAPQLRLYSGAMPANCATAPTGTLLATLSLPADWMTGAAAGAKALQGVWSGVGAAGAGAGTNIGYFRIYDSGGTSCHDQGTVTATGGGGDLTFDNINVATGQAISIAAFTLTAGNS